MSHSKKETMKEDIEVMQFHLKKCSDSLYTARDELKQKIVSTSFLKKCLSDIYDRISYCKNMIEEFETHEVELNE